MISLTFISFTLAKEKWVFNNISTKIKPRKPVTQDQLWDQDQHYHKEEVHEVRAEETGLEVLEGHFVVSEHVLVLSFNLNLTSVKLHKFHLAAW